MATQTAQVIIEIDDKSLIELNSEIKQLETEISKLKIGTQEWNKANQKLGDLKNQFNSATKEAQKLQNVISSNSTTSISGGIRSVAKLGAGLVGTFAAVSGSIKLLGGNSEVFDEMTAKATTLMSIMGGLNQIAELFSVDTLTNLKGIGKGFGSLVTTVRGASLGIKAALVSTGIGALVVGVGLLIANFDKIKNLLSGADKEREQAAKKNLLLAQGEAKTAEARYNTQQKLLELYKKISEYGKTDEETAANKKLIADKELETAKEEMQIMRTKHNELVLANKEKEQELYTSKAIKDNIFEARLVEKKANEERLAQILEIEGEQAKEFALLAEKYAKTKTVTDEEKKRGEIIWNSLEALQTETKKLEDRNKEIDKEIYNKKKLKDLSYITLQAEIDANAAQAEGIRNEAKILQLKIEEAEATARITVEVEKANERIRDNQNRITKLSAELYKSNELYKANRAILTDQLKIVNKQLSEEALATEELKQQKETLEAQIVALDTQETIRENQLTIEFNLLATQREEEKELAKLNGYYREITDSLLEEYNLINKNKKSFEDEVNNAKNLSEQYQQFYKTREAIANFDERGVGLHYQQNQAFYDRLLTMNELFSKTAAMINMQLEGKKYDEDKIDNAAKELGFFIQIADATKNKLELDKIGLENRKKDLLAQQRLLEDTNKILEGRRLAREGEIELLKIQFEQAKNDEERKAILEKVVEQEGKLAEINQQIVDNKTEIINLNGDIINTEDKILETTQKIDETTQSVIDKNKELADTIEQQSRTYAKMQEFLKDYGEEIQVVQQLIAQSLEFMAALQERKAAEAQERIDDYNKQLDELDEKEEERVSKLAEYEELLRDANGERYDELLRLIEQEKAANISAQETEDTKRQEIEARIKDEENKKLAAEARAAKWRKAQAIIDAVIQGALAVIKALPNVFLAVATGVLAAAGVATIAAQKTPDVPKGYAVGGMTPKGNPNEVAGIVHKSEYVVPAYVTQSSEAQAHIAALEKQRLRGYAEGGVVMPAASTNAGGFIDYDRLITGISSAIKEMPNPVVSVQKITRAQKEVAITKQLAGL